MRILFYNWIQFDKKNNSGGGVNVYQKNTIDYLIKNTDHEIFFLSSGIYYDVVSKKIRITETKNEYGERCKTFKLINSRCMAPVKAMYEDIDTYLKDMDVYRVFASFIAKNNIDVVHFNNLEGLPLNCLKIKRDFPDIKVVYSLHNYFMFCPQVNLFYNGEENCKDFCNGKACTKCLGGSIGRSQFSTYYRIDTSLEKLHMEKQSENIKLFFKNAYQKLKGKKQDVQEEETVGEAADFFKFRRHNVGTLNKYVDVILAVSDRVRDIAVSFGVQPEKVKTCYIGTKVAEESLGRYHGRADENCFTIAFMGYFEKVKGLEVLLDALEEAPEELCKKLKFKCYARRKVESDDVQIQRIKKLGDKLYSAEHYDGYNHDELPDIMKSIDLGIVPVIWEDNLPQVAIEFAAYGVPVLTSNLGGAQELSRCEDFRFEAGNTKDLIAKLEKIVNDSSLPDKYFAEAMKLVTVKEHIDALLDYYSK